MRDIIEIGIGREARRSYSLDQLSIVPTRRTRSSHDVNVAWHFDAYHFECPFIAHPTDALSHPRFVEEMSRLGGLAVVNAEGLWGRHEDLETALSSIVDAATSAAERGDTTSPEAAALLKELHSAELNPELLARRIRTLRSTTDATVAVRISPQHVRTLAPVVVEAGADILFVQGTIISAEHVDTTGAALNLKEFIGTLDIPVVAGGVVDYTTALHLMRAGAAGVIVGSGTNENDATLGINVPMATAIADVAAARRDYLDETGGRYVHVIADSDEITCPGSAAKAIACGADAVMLGAPLASTREAAAKGWFWPSVTAHPSLPRGFVSRPQADASAPQQRTLKTVLTGPAADAVGTENFVGGLRRAMAKCGYSEVKNFQRVELRLC